MESDMDQHFEEVLQDPSQTQDDSTLPLADSPVEAEPNPDVLRDQLQNIINSTDDSKLGHICIVLSPQIRKQLMQGEPLIIGTSTASVEAFFQRLITVCQQGAHMPVMFQTLSGAVTVANIKKRKTGILTESSGRTERYPVPPSSKLVSKRTKTPSTTGEADLGAADAESSGKKTADRDEIPLEAIRLYLTEQRYFPGWNANAKRNLRKRCKDFILDHTGRIRYQTKKGTSLLCIEDKAQRMNVIWEAHVLDHRRRDGLLNSLREKYYWKGMFQDVNKVLDSCAVCGSQRAQKTKEREGTVEQDEFDSSGELKAKLSRAKKSTEYFDKPTTPEPTDPEKYPETSEVSLADR